MTNREDKRRRLERAGYAYVRGWVPTRYAAQVVAQVEMHRDDVERIASEPPKPRGRPSVAREAL